MRRRSESAVSFVLCGKVLPGHRLEVRGADGKVLDDREVGRIFVAGPSIMPGYFDEPEATRDVLSDDGWLDTGDLGYSLDGELVVTGRAKDLIIVNGRNVWPQDIEWAIDARKVAKNMKPNIPWAEFFTASDALYPQCYWRWTNPKTGQRGQKINGGTPQNAINTASSASEIRI